jgi:predicted lysophospholipase L1 biosynthesis ABC-type transport system permease subunit
LRAAGLSVFQDDSLAARQHRLAVQGPAAAARFGLLAGALGLLLAAAALSVAAGADRGGWAGELRGLRAQGLPGAAVTSIGFGGYVTVAVLGVLSGLSGTVVARYLAGTLAPVFVDGWATLPVPHGLRPGALGLAALAGLIVLGAAGWLAAAALVRAARRDNGAAG